MRKQSTAAEQAARTRSFAAFFSLPLILSNHGGGDDARVCQSRMVPTLAFDQVDFSA